MPQSVYYYTIGRDEMITFPNWERTTRIFVEFTWGKILSNPSEGFSRDCSESKSSTSIVSFF
jgi:nicotinic acid mononucleotide adenylyltransferase